jgi:transposase
MQDAAAAPPLPDDPPTLKRMVGELLDTLRDQRRENEKLRSRVDQLLRRIYGPRSEQINPDQRLLFDTVPSEPTHTTAPPVEPIAQPQRNGRHGRRKLPKDLPRQRVEYDLAAAEKPCPDCGEVRVRFGEDRSERLDYRPASFFIVEHIRAKYVCRRCAGQILTAPAPAEAVPKCIAGPGLLAHVIISKYADHLPLHRLEGILARHGVPLSRSTMGDWLRGCAAALAPLYLLMCDRVRQSKVIHTDDTPVTTLDRGDPDGRKTGRVWVYLGDRDHPYTVYDMTASRSRDGPRTFLDGFAGYLQADAFGGYDGLYARGVTEVACWAHARRKFFEAKETGPAEAHEALARIRALYEIEARAKALAPVERAALRQAEAAPMLASFGCWLDDLRPQTLPKSPLGQAVTYASNQWAALHVYVTDGDLAIDNNAAERALRKIAVGRRNWLFFGSDDGGATAAVLFSFTETCHRHAINPWTYFVDALTRLPNHSVEQLGDFLPDRWAGSTLRDQTIIDRDRCSRTDRVLI